MFEQIIEALLTSAGILWKSFWALVFGYTISAAIQVLVTRSQMARILGKRGPKRGVMAGFFGFISSSCSFAALAASRLESWQAIADAFFMEWKMVYKEILFGFTIAGFISVFVPQSFWDALFLNTGSNTSSFLVVLENALIAPVVAFFTFIGSMGNVPLAAMLWSKNASFGGVMSFLGANLVAATVIYLHAKYYGWKYAAYLSGLFYICMVAAGVTVHGLFAVLGLIPTERPSLTKLVRFQIDYTFWLKILGCVAVSTLAGPPAEQI